MSRFYSAENHRTICSIVIDKIIGRIAGSTGYYCGVELKITNIVFMR